MEVLFLLHGFNIKDEGALTTDLLKPYFFIEKLIDNDYGYTLLSVRFVDQEKSIDLAIDIALEKDKGNTVHLVGHSNGCTIIYRAVTHIKDEKLQPDKLIFINPSLKPNLTFPVGIKSIHVFFSPHDWATLLAGILNPVPGPITLWGNMGRKGYKGTDTRVINYNEEEVYKTLTGTYMKFGHSTIFDPKVLEAFGPFLQGVVQGG